MARDDLQFLFGQFVPRCRHRIDKHFVDYSTLQYMDGGSVHLHVGDRGHRLVGRQFWSCFSGPRFAFHVAAPQESWPHRYLAFRGGLLDRWKRDGLFPIAPQPAPPGQDSAARFDLLLVLAHRTDPYSRRRAVLMLELMLTELAEARANGPKGGKISASLAEIDRTEGAIDIDALSARAGLSARSFRRHFRAATGTTARDAIIHRRIDRARRLLGETNLPIKVIAEQLGYSDVFFFGRQFKKHTGATPALYRRSRES
ncbi:MAG TPA: AraC family transcriptional regulator [Tepidisphaeraceae bacterium]|nr:AraC family transcriptional regulator [Tepidisphaeraceae bacterium]